MASKKKTDTGIAIVALLLNVFILPGIGSIIGGRVKEGIWQIVLSVGGLFIILISIPLMLVIVGFVLLPLGGTAMLAGWIWGLVSGIQLIQESS